MSPARKNCSAPIIRRPAGSGAGARCALSPAVRKPRAISRSNWRNISSPTRRRPPWSKRLAQSLSQDRRRPSRRDAGPDRFSRELFPRRRPKCARRGNLSSPAPGCLDSAPDDPGPVISALAMLGQPLWRPPGPNGFSDDVRRLGLARGHEAPARSGVAMGDRLRDPPDPRELLDVRLRRRRLGGNAAGRRPRRNAAARPRPPPDGAGGAKTMSNLSSSTSPLSPRSARRHRRQPR